jgi:hypothetical protein
MGAFMKSVCEKYAFSTNSSRNRVGHVFEGRYKSRHIDKPAYLLNVSRYIHLNPVQAQLVDWPELWKYSSCAAYLGEKADDFVTKEAVLSLAGGRDAYTRYLRERSPDYGEDIEEYLIDSCLL